VNTLKPKIYHGQKAVDKVCEVYNLKKPLPLPMETIILHEGYCDGEYKDDKGVITKGVGQTRFYLDKPFPEVYESFVRQTKDLTPQFEFLNEETKAAILSAMYRGDWQQSRKTRMLFNQGKFKEAAKEFLNNNDYNQRKLNNTNDGVVKRMDYIAKVIASNEV
jgi:GH24 family phage-related lysozyme (muramidase)